MTCGGSQAFSSTTIFEKCGVDLACESRIVALRKSIVSSPIPRFFNKGMCEKILNTMKFYG